MPLTREQHIKYTREEWSGNSYFIEIINLLKQKNVNSFLDIGSNVGEVANILSENINSLKQFILIEPQIDNFVFLKQNTRALKNCIYYPYGIYYGKKEAELFQDPSWKNVGAFTVEVIQSNFKSTGEKIQLKTLEELNLPNIDLVKIDVEGSEYNILKNSLYLKTVNFIEVEFHDWSIDPIKFITTNIPSHRVLFYDENMSNHLLLEKL